MFHNATDKPRALKLMIVADDITGTLDTGVQFLGDGVLVQVAATGRLPDTAPDADVLIVNAETRHLSPDETYRRMYPLAGRSAAWRVPYLYVKTDSGLRGNIGMALKAALDATACRLAAFAPAYPEINRITRNGRQLISGRPIADSVFGKDLFNPVSTSSICDLIAPFGLETLCVKRGPIADIHVSRPTVAIFDAEESGDFERIAAYLVESDQMRVTAGCAAFAASLSPFLGLPRATGRITHVDGPLLVVCGSLNPITKRQIGYGERLGYPHVVYPLASLMNQEYWDSEDGRRWLEGLRMLLQKGNTVLLDTAVTPFGTPDDCTHIADQIGKLLLRLLSLEEARRYTPMVIGGDTLTGFLNQLETPDISLEGEAAVGVVIFSLCVGGRPVRMLSKSGGFGSETLIQDVMTAREFAR